MVSNSYSGYYTRSEIDAIIEKWKTFWFDGLRVLNTDVYDHGRTVETFLTLQGGERLRFVLLVKSE